MKNAIKPFVVSALLASASQVTSASIIGWTSFDPEISGNNASGIDDNTPEVNDTFGWLTGTIGPDASSGNNGEGFKGTGQNANNLSGMNDAEFGLSGALHGQSGNSVWRFDSNGQRNGDFQITNNSAYFFQLTTIHFDARRGAAGSPDELDLVYVAGPGNLQNKTTGSEVGNLQALSDLTFAGSPTIIERSQGMAGGLDANGGTAGKTFLAPGDSATFRFRWTSNTGAGQSHIDNLALEGSFFQTSALLAEVTPVPVPAAAWLFGSAVAGLIARKRLSR